MAAEGKRNTRGDFLLLEEEEEDGVNTQPLRGGGRGGGARAPLVNLDGRCVCVADAVVDSALLGLLLFPRDTDGLQLLRRQSCWEGGLLGGI